MSPPPISQCPSHHDKWTLMLSLGLCTGLIISYLPQHLRIITKGTSEGLSPWFLLLGATSSASGMLNMLIMQWPLFRCCRVVSAGQCFESLLRFAQVWLQWLLFSIVMILYIKYFPKVPRMHVHPPGEEEHAGSNESAIANANANGSARNGRYGATTVPHVPTPADAPAARERLAAIRANDKEWRTALGVSWIVALHLTVLLTLSLVLLWTLPPRRPPALPLRRLATFCGLSATALAICQYAPQIARTYSAGVVGALSIGTMCIQVPGSVLFVVSILVGQDTDWTSWLPYAVTGGMQACLLVICLLWKRRQAALGVDDFGNPLPERTAAADERTPLLPG